MSGDDEGKRDVRLMEQLDAAKRQLEHEVFFGASVSEVGNRKPTKPRHAPDAWSTAWSKAIRVTEAG